MVMNLCELKLLILIEHAYFLTLITERFLDVKDKNKKKQKPGSL